MNRPESLSRLLASITATAWEYRGDGVSLHIHVDRDPANGEGTTHTLGFVETCLAQVGCTETVSRLPGVTSYLQAGGM